MVMGLVIITLFPGP